ncbi:MAG: hypothetical protein KIT00_09030 [Rhodospirillales bacterium]|nr:hypothetical protein [Rhodospirillales bacterium]
MQAIQNQITPGTRVFDLGLALEMARARGYDLDIMSELLPEAQAGMLEATIDSQPE